MTAFRIDFETRSTVDLKKTGVHIYAKDPTTDVWCAAYAFDDEPVQLWLPGDPCPWPLFEHVFDGGLVSAFNAAFERIIWREIMGPRYGWPVPRLEQYRCTMAMSLAMALPGSLEEACPAVGLDIVKDMAGHRLMLQMSRPRSFKDGVPIWWDDAERREKLYAYCKQDVEAERALEKRLFALRPSEQELWFLDQRINDRGVRIDRALCRSSESVIAQATASADARMRSITGNEVSACSNSQQLAAWIRRQGFGTEGVAKDAIAYLLERPDLTPSVREAVELRQAAAKASTAKVQQFMHRSAGDGRMRGNLQYHGASTGRWAGRGAQLQNLPRPSKAHSKAMPMLIEALRTGNAEWVEMLLDRPLDALASALRGMIIAAPGRKLVASDFSNIEGRVLAWLAGEETTLDAFRAFDAGTGPDLYLVAAAGIYNVPLASLNENSPERQTGKVAELALGYQGGVGAFQSMAAGYGVKIGEALLSIERNAAAANLEKAADGWKQRGRGSGTPERDWMAAELVKLAWRDNRPKTVQLWKELDAGAIEAVQNPGAIVEVGYVAYRMSGSFLWCKLPNGRCLCYPYPRIVRKPAPWDEQKSLPAIVYKGIDSRTHKWSDQDLYGGKSAENITQAVARDLMAEGMVRVEAAGYPVVLTVHDEVVAEPPASFGSEPEFSRLLSTLPAWAKGCPVSAKGWEGDRYRK